MDFIAPVIIFIVFVILISVCCGYCCKRNKQGIVYGVATQPTVTTTTYTAGNPPYPVSGTPMPHPQPSAAAGVGFAPHMPYPPATPYPPQGYPPASVPFGYHPMPMPTTDGFGSHPAPYPPMPSAAPLAPYPTSTQQPPSYAEAVTQSPINSSTTTEGYAKQSPYNPNF